MLRVILFDLLLFAACAYAFWRGGREERLIASACVVANFLSYALLAPETFSYSAVEIGVLAVDVLALAVSTLR